MGNKQSKISKITPKQETQAHVTIYSELFATSNEKHNGDILNYYLRICLIDPTIIFPKSIKKVIIKYTSFVIPNILLFIEQKIIQTSNNYFENIGMQLIKNRNKAKELMFDTMEFWNSSMEEMETKLLQSQFEFDCCVYMELLREFFNSMPVEILGFIQYDVTLQEIANDPIKCVKYLNENFVDNTTKTLYWWLVKIMTEITKHADKNKMDAHRLSIIFGSCLVSVEIHSGPKFMKPNYDINIALAVRDIVNKIIESSILYLLGHEMQ